MIDHDDHLGKLDGKFVDLLLLQLPGVPVFAFLWESSDVEEFNLEEDRKSVV